MPFSFVGCVGSGAGRGRLPSLWHHPYQVIRHGCRVHAVPGAWLGHPCSMNRAAGAGPAVTAVRRERTDTTGPSQAGTTRSRATQAQRHCAGAATRHPRRKGGRTGVDHMSRHCVGNAAAPGLGPGPGTRRPTKINLAGDTRFAPARHPPGLTSERHAFRGYLP
jgi:hypothetical protein